MRLLKYTTAALLLVSLNVAAQDWFVAKDGTGFGTSWADATNSIQGAIDASTPSASSPVTIWVSNGVWNTGGVTNYPSGSYLTNRVALRKAHLTLRAWSTNPADTVIEGAWDPLTTNGPAAVRGVYMAANTTLAGFTVRGCATVAAGSPGVDARNETWGGGVGGIVYNTTRVLSNCVFVGCAAQVNGGGAEMSGKIYNCIFKENICFGYAGSGCCHGTLYDCTFVSNKGAKAACNQGIHYNSTFIDNSSTCIQDGTAYDSHFENNAGRCSSATIMWRCTLVGNVGGGSGGTLYDCMVVSNTAANGAGLYDGNAYRTVFIGNRSTISGGAIHANAAGKKIYNCLIVGNEAASYAGGVHGRRGMQLYNCTVVGNKAGIKGGGVVGGYPDGEVPGLTVCNSIIYSNDAPVDPNWANVAGTAPTFTNSCTFPEQPGWAVGNITDYPLFIEDGTGFGQDHVAGDYRLARRSPCIDVGMNMDWMDGEVDLDGKPRIFPEDGIVDIGAYEFDNPPPVGTFLTVK